jgi:hypothetical protein
MLIPMSTELLNSSANYLEASGLDQVLAHAPAYEAGDLLHPLVDEANEGQTPIVAPFTIHKFGLVVASPNKETFILRLVPPADKQISPPIILPEDRSFSRYLPTVGFAGLQAVLEAESSSSGSFSLFGEDEQGEIVQELAMPSLASAEKFVEVVSGQVTIKAVAELRNQARKRQQQG